MAYFRFAVQCLIRILVFLSTVSLHAQTLGGHSVFNFLNLSNTPQLTALGGINVSQTTNDIGLAFNNPALLRPGMHSQMNAVFNSFYAGIKAYHLSLGYHHPQLNTNFAWGLHYFSYGKMPHTDAGGNRLGDFRATDWVMQWSAARSYLKKWNYGASLKFMASAYGQYSSNGMAVDAAVLYLDSSKQFSVSVLVKNMGFQLKKYEGTQADDLPFDLQAGITKKLAHAPFGFSFTAHHLHRFDLVYNDENFNNENGFSSPSSFIDKLFRHFVLAVGIYPDEKLECIVGYNYLRRTELNVPGSRNGLNGFSIGAGVILPKLQIRYAQAYYQNNSAYHQLGLNLKLNDYFGLGKFGEKIGW